MTWNGDRSPDYYFIEIFAVVIAAFLQRLLSAVWQTSASRQQTVVFRGGAATTIITHTAAMLSKRALQPNKVQQTNAITICWLQIPLLLGAFNQESRLSWSRMTDGWADSLQRAALAPSGVFRLFFYSACNGLVPSRVNPFCLPSRAVFGGLSTVWKKVGLLLIWDDVHP